MKGLKAFARISEYKKDFPLLYEAAMTNLVRRRNSVIEETIGGFIWGSTPEGYHFWHNVYLGEIHIAMQIKPHLFETLDENVIKNGFFNKLKTVL